MSGGARRFAPIRGTARLIWNPILERELRSSGRRISTYVMRMLYAAAFSVGALIAVAALIEETSYAGSVTRRAQSLSQIGASTATFVGWFQFITLVFLAPIMTAPSVCEEKQRGTLGALMTTPLSALQIVLGKLTGRLYQALLLALISVPLLFAVRVFGGVTMELILSFTLVTFTTVLFAGSLGLLFATWHARAAPAAIFALLTLGVIFAFPPIAYFAMEQSSFYDRAESMGLPADGIRSLAPLGVAACPPYMLLRMSTDGLTFSGIPWLQGTWFDRLWLISSVLMLLGSFITLIITSRVLRGIMLEQSGGAAAQPAKEETKNPKRKRSKGPRLGSLGSHPVYWREASRRWIVGGFEKWVLGGVLVFSLGFAYWKSDLAEPPLHFLIAFSAISLLLLCAAVMTSSSINGERASDTWDTLMTSSVSAREVILGKYLAALRRLVPFMALIALHFVVTIAGGHMRVVGGIMAMLLIISPAILYLATGLALSLFFRKTAVSSTANIVLPLAVLLGIPVGTVIILQLVLDFSSDHDWLLNTMFASHPFLLLGSVIDGEIESYLRSNDTPFTIANDEVSTGAMLTIVIANTLVHVLIALGVLKLCISKFTRLAGRSS